MTTDKSRADAGEPLPCQFCGSDDLYLDDALGKRAVICNHCEANGPTGEDDADAIVAWNRRAPASQPAAAPIACPTCGGSLTTWKCTCDPMWEGYRNASAPADERAAVAYLDLGVGGYMDVGTDLTDVELAALPKGRHMLGIIGTYGVEGYKPARASSANETGAEDVRAWETDDGRVISDEQKQQPLRDGGVSASSVRPFHIALGKISPAQAAEPVAISRHEADGLEIISGWLDKDGLIEPAKLLRILASRCAAPQPPAQARAHEGLADAIEQLNGLLDACENGSASERREARSAIHAFYQRALLATDPGQPGIACAGGHGITGLGRMTDELRAELEWCAAEGNCGPRTRAAIHRVLAAHPGQPEPIDMLLFCPKCGVQHVDAPETEPGRLISSGPNAGRAVAPKTTWSNPPHRSHLCAKCGCIWRPADVPTNGVAAIETRGKADTWNGQPEPRTDVTANDVSRLMRFVGLVLKDHRNGGYPGDVDGSEIQGYAEQCGLIEERQVTEPCSETCSCTDFGQFPTMCYFNTDLGKVAIAAARTGSQS
ncbi:Lar family restriction alleviation protein [Burkholderia cenocepacia]|uniref:Lar family restriction alleviation protein n=1 Tax=Burkholderia cenocepacia TaxID=95486 RepID=UPI002ABE0457|nr:Lar family restriction alleviation protein [Burkholderia cenocepacia]